MSKSKRNTKATPATPAVEATPAVVEVATPVATPVAVATPEETYTVIAREVMGSELAQAWCNVTKGKNPLYRIGTPASMYPAELVAKWKRCVETHNNEPFVFWGIGSSYTAAVNSAKGAVAKYNAAATPAVAETKTA